MKLYDARTPNSLRVQVFLTEKRIDIDRVPVDVMGGGTRTHEFLAKNSLGELPVLELDDGTLLTESVAICRYLEGLHPEPNLFGKTPLEQAQIEMWNRRIEQQLFDTIGAMARHTFKFFADKVEQNPEFAAAQVRCFDKNWAWLDAELADGRAFVAGDRFTVADITGMAALMVCGLAEKSAPVELKHAKRWEQAMLSRSSFAAQLQTEAA